MPETDIAGEDAALDRAIARLEAEFGGQSPPAAGAREGAAGRAVGGPPSPDPDGVTRQSHGEPDPDDAGHQASGARGHASPEAFFGVRCAGDRREFRRRRLGPRPRRARRQYRPPRPPPRRRSRRRQPRDLLSRRRRVVPASGPPRQRRRSSQQSWLRPARRCRWRRRSKRGRRRAPTTAVWRRRSPHRRPRFSRPPLFSRLPRR